MISLGRPSSGRRMILARITSQYGDVYFLARDSSACRSSLERSIVNGLFLGIRGTASLMPRKSPFTMDLSRHQRRGSSDARVSDYVTVWVFTIRHCIYEWMYLAAVVGRVFRGELRPLFRQVVERENGRHRADRHAGAAVDALDRIDVQHLRLGVIGLVLFGMDAVHRAGVYARGIFGSNAGFCNHVCHGDFSRSYTYHSIRGNTNHVTIVTTMPMKVRKAVFPAAGLGTRFLPATKAQPKEMLPLVDKPIIQYAVEEAIASDIRNIIIVTGRGKSAIEDHFDVSFELEYLLSSRSKNDLLAIVRNVSDMIDVAYVRQKEALGLGHAVLRARELIGEEPFSVVLADDVIDARVPCLKQLCDIYDFFHSSVVAVMEVPPDKISAYGCIDAEPMVHRGVNDRLFRVRNLVEKPKASEAPSNLAIIGRYVLTPEVFDSLQAIEPGAGMEIQLTDALKHLLRSRPIYAYKFEGRRHDAGDKLGFLKATVEFALQREDLGGPFREYLKSLKL